MRLHGGVLVASSRARLWSWVLISILLGGRRNADLRLVTAQPLWALKVRSSPRFAEQQMKIVLLQRTCSEIFSEVNIRYIVQLVEASTWYSLQRAHSECKAILQRAQQVQKGP